MWPFRRKYQPYNGPPWQPTPPQVSQQPAASKGMDEQAQPHTFSSEQNTSDAEADYRKQLASWSVDTIFTELTSAQRRCLLLQEDLYTRAALQSFSMQQWQAFQGAVRSLLDFLRTFQEGDAVGEAVLQQRDAYINLLERYLDGSPLQEPAQPIK